MNNKTSKRILIALVAIAILEATVLVVSAIGITDSNKEAGEVATFVASETTNSDVIMTEILETMNSFLDAIETIPEITKAADKVEHTDSTVETCTYSVSVIPEEVESTYSETASSEITEYSTVESAEHVELTEELVETESGNWSDNDEEDNMYLGTFTLTAYCSCSQCCGSYADNRPTDENGNPIIYTASGAIAKPNHTIAVDPSVIPYGTAVIINGVTYVAEDCGGGVNGNHIDIYFDNHDDAWNFGRQYADVYLVG